MKKSSKSPSANKKNPQAKCTNIYQKKTPDNTTVCYRGKVKAAVETWTKDKLTASNAN